jgi:hypothetical protein
MVGSARILAVAFLAFVLAACAADSAPARKYESGYHTMARLSEDLYRALPKDKRGELLNRPVLIDKKAPYLQPELQSRPGSNAQAVVVSEGLIDVLNYVSHAKAVDQVSPGFFAKAVNGLANENGDRPVFFPITHQKSWDFNTMNWQLSGFNQMAAGLCAIEMAHHYLGHYQKYASQLGDSKKPQPLYTVLTPKEWREAVLRGSRHSLECGLAPEGLIVLYDAISRLPKRPSWAVQVIPPAAEVSILRLELKRVEATFFDMRTATREEFDFTW